MNQTMPHMNPLPPKIPLINHLEELRTTLIRALIAVGIASSICLFFSKELYFLLVRPLTQVLPQNASIIVTHPIEAWMVYFKAGLIAGCFLSLPYLFILVWKFAAPGLYTKEKRIVLPLASSFGVLFVLGASFGYFVIFPIGFEALVGFLKDSPIRFFPTMENVFSFSVWMLIAFGLVFEVPLLVIGLIGSGLVSYQKLASMRKYNIVIALTIGGILTPSVDPLSQILMAIPLLILFEIGMAVSWILIKIKLRTGKVPGTARLNV